MHRLVCSGQFPLGQTGWGHLDSMALDVIIDFAYGELVGEYGPEQREQLDARLAALDGMHGAQENLVEVTTSDGNVIYITEERRERIRRNAAIVATKGR